MKKKVFILLTLAIVATVSLKAQLNVGSTAPADVSAILQATSITKGFLPPVMTTTQINAIVLPANGLTVYNTTLSQLQVNVGTTLVPSWAVGAGGANVYWSQQGNTGTVPGTNYVGTTDNAPLAFRTNGVERVRIDSATGNVGIGNSAPSQKLTVGNAALGAVSAPTTILMDPSYSNVAGQKPKLVLHNNSDGPWGIGISNSQLDFIIASPNASHVFYTQGLEKMRLAANGQMTISGAAPVYYFNDATRPGRQGAVYASGGLVRLWQSQYGDGVLLDSTGVVTIPKALSMNNNNNIFIGAQSGLLTSGTGNSFLGIRSGLNNTSGANNTFSGYESGLSNTSGGSNVFYGFQSGRSNVVTGANLFIGYQSGYSNANVNNNQFIGYQSGYTNTNGWENTFTGAQTGYYNTSGINNTFTGQWSGQSNTTGNSNVFAGWHSGLANTTGSNNGFVGSEAGFSTTTGYNNVSFGLQSGYANTTGVGNSFVGNYSGNGNTTGNFNASIGYNAGPASGGLTNTTSVGYNTQATQSNTVILGSGVNVGINMTTPSRTLQVNGAVKAGLDNAGSVILNSNGSSRTGYTEWYKNGTTRMGYIGDDPTDLYYRAESGAQHRFSGANVIVENSIGIGTSAPATRLQVVSGDNSTNTIIDAQPNNQSIGVGIWYGGIRSTGSNVNNDLALDAKGTGVLRLNNPTVINGNAYVNSNAYINGNTVISGGYSNTPLSISSNINGAKITLYDGSAGSTTDDFGFGTSGGQLNYTVWNGSNHCFFSGGKNGSGTIILKMWNGNSQFWGNVYYTGALTQNSDSRLKRNIVPLNKALGQVMQLMPYSYEKKNTIESTDYSVKEMGFLAQDIRKILPELVFEGKDSSKTLSVNYISLIPLLTKAIQEQQAQNDTQVAITKAQQAEIALLRKENISIAAQLSEMKELKIAMAQMRSELNKTTVTQAALPIPVTVNN